MPYLAHWSEETLSRADIDSLKGITLLEFGVDWCPHCQNIQADLERLLEKHEKVRHIKVEDGKGRPLGRTFAVKLWPNFVILKDGAVMEQLARPQSSDIEKALISAVD